MGSTATCLTMDLDFAGIVWRLTNHCRGLSMYADSRSAEFLKYDAPTSHCSVDVCWSNDFSSLGDVIFDAGIWRAYSGDGFIFDFQTETLGPQPYKCAIFNRDLTRGEVRLNENLLRQKESYYPFEYRSTNLP